MSSATRRRSGYHGKRVLVTGADGFIGSHLVERLIAEGARVTAFVRGTSRSGTTRFELRNLRPVERELEAIIAADVSGRDAGELIRQARPQVVFHLAAAAYVPYSFEHPLEVTQANVIGTLNVLEAAREDPRITRVVCTSSSEIYGRTVGAAIDEEHPLYPTSPYAASKVAADRFCFAYHNAYRTPVAVIRPFNTYGPRHTYDVIPKFIDDALAGRPLTVHGSGRQSRDFTYVDDIVDAFLIMGRHPRAVGRAVNFGSGRAVTINTLASKIKGITGSSSPIVHTAERMAQVKKLRCDYSLAQRLFRWRPKVDLDEGLRRNVQWARRQISPPADGERKSP